MRELGNKRLPFNQFPGNEAGGEDHGNKDTFDFTYARPGIVPGWFPAQQGGRGMKIIR